MKKIRVFTILAIGISLLLSSFFPPELAEKFFYRRYWFGFLWIILAIDLILCLREFYRRKKFGAFLVHFGLLLIILAGLINAKFKEVGYIELKEGQSQDGFWIEDDLFKPIDFSIHLKAISREFYPQKIKGMYFIKSYRSQIAISKGGNLVKEGVIEVNRPMKFEGFWIYQFGDDPKFPKQTLLQIVRDPSLGWVYLGYLSLLLGLIVSFKRIWKI